MTNEAFSRAKIDAQLRDLGWEITNTNAVRLLEEKHAAAHQLTLKFRGLAQELVVLGVVAEVHHPLKAGPVVPAAV